MKSLAQIVADNANATPERAHASMQEQRLLGTARKFEEIRTAWNRYNHAQGYLIGVENSDMVGMADEIESARRATYQRRVELDDAMRRAFLDDFTRRPATVAQEPEVEA